MSSTIHTVYTADGRKLSVVEAGNSDGFPILVHHGTPGSGLLFNVWIADAMARGIRLISYDRSGYGSSSRFPGRDVASAASDVSTIAQALNLEKIAVWGFSGGGPHTLACAALLPELVTSAAILAGVAPYPADGIDWMAGMGEDNVAEFSAALQGEAAVRQFVEHAAAGFLGADLRALVEAFRSLLSPVDAAVLSDEYGQDLLNSILIGINDGRDGWIDDDLTFVKSWGFELSQIKVPVLLMQGDQDLMVPPAHGKWLAERIPGVDVRFLPKEGHLTLTAELVPEVHKWLLSKS